MNTSDLVKAFCEQANSTVRKAGQITSLVFGTMAKAFADGDRTEIRGFGSFTAKEYEWYTGRDSKTGEQIAETAKRLQFCKTGKELKDKVDRKGGCSYRHDPVQRLLYLSTLIHYRSGKLP